MKKEISSKYSFKEIEQGLYDFWIENEFFNSQPESNKPPFTIVIPPPNVTGILHLGHACDSTYQDIIIRRKRMQGYDALYLPGMDHAGIATQAKIEEKLKNEGLSRYQLGREGFLKKAWEWKDKYANIIKQQWKALGLSLDYSKERFTLDQKLNDAVNHVFINLYDKGLIYRGLRIINWDSEAKTALSNIEVEYQETQGKLYYIKYKLVDSNDYVVIATTRPETMFADQAVMVNPKDERYKHLVGKKVLIPTTNVEIPIIMDDYVDIEFGTGIVKVTPAHDPNDFEVANRHNLNKPLCMSEDGTMNEMAFGYQNLNRFECRNFLIEDLKKLKQIEKIEDYVHQVGYSERTGVMVEPRLSLQWFVKMDTLAKQTLDKSKVNFHPERFKKVFDNWLVNIQDWCVSRQLWWGHRIPAWYKDDAIKVQVESPGEGWHQDDDVLDTWFSSALWPFSTLNWPDTSDVLFKKYYPTNVLVTAYDIIFFWVSRMVFQALEFTNKDPFKDCLIHGLIRASDGKKMSKSLGNGIDPMDVIDKYGIDALRYFLTTNSTLGADLRYDEEKVESSWNFINKLYNITRFISLNVDEEKNIDYKKLNVYDKWILTRLSEVIDSADEFYEKYEFNEVSRVLYNFIWDEFASWYLELSKVSLLDNEFKENTQGVLLYVLKAILKLMHPFIPFVTERLFLSIFNEKTITLSSWPKSDYRNEQSLKDFSTISDIITKIRNLRADNNVAPSKKIEVILEYKDKKTKVLLEDNFVYLNKFINSSHLKITANPVGDDLIFMSGLNVNIHVVKSDIIDKEVMISKLQKLKENLEKEIARSKSLLENQNFISKAPKDKLRVEEEKYADYLNQYNDLLMKLKEYGIQ